MSSGTAGFSDKQSQDSGAYPYNGKVLLAAVISLSVVILFVLLLHVYARWFLRRRPMTFHVVREPLHRWSFSTFPGHTMEVSLPGDGLDPRVVASLPVFVYRSAEHANGLDCVVCLSVMEEDEEGRILPECKHAFHVGCIDMWLLAHSTCPVCRAPVRVDETSVVVGEAASVAISMARTEEVLQDEQRSMSGELVSEGGALETSDVVVEVPGNAAPICQSCKSYEPSSSSSSPLSSPTNNYLGCSLKRMLSKSKSENRVFPSALVT